MLFQTLLFLFKSFLKLFILLLSLGYKSFLKGIRHNINDGIVCWIGFPKHSLVIVFLWWRSSRRQPHVHIVHISSMIEIFFCVLPFKSSLFKPLSFLTDAQVNFFFLKLNVKQILFLIYHWVEPTLLLFKYLHFILSFFPSQVKLFLMKVFVLKRINVSSLFFT